MSISEFGLSLDWPTATVFIALLGVVASVVGLCVYALGRSRGEEEGMRAMLLTAQRLGSSVFAAAEPTFEVACPQCGAMATAYRAPLGEPTKREETKP